MNQKKYPTRRKFITSAGILAAGVASISKPSTGHCQSSPSVSAIKPKPIDDVDVLVVGGGPAGIGAALGASLKGARTLVIEHHSFFGGVAAWSMGMQMNQMRPGGRARSKIHEFLIDKVKAYGSQAIRLGQHEIWCHVEYLKVAILDALEQANCRYLVHVRAADALVESNRVTGVIAASKAGLINIRAKAVVDCTGDGDVAFFAGAETMKEPDILMPMTLGLTLSNVDATQVRAPDIEKVIRQARSKHPLITSGFLEIKQVANTSSWWINHAGTSDLGRLDPTDLEQRTRAECFSRRQALQMIQAIQESGNPALQKIEWGAAGPQVSVRESRRVKGVYVITEEDAMSGRTFADTIAWRSGFLDLGGQKGGKYVKMRIHDVPYRSILPEKIDGLLMAGRCISASHEGAAAGKSMGNCIATGHAAGVAAAIAASTNRTPREVNISDLQNALRADGVDLALGDREQSRLR